MATDRISGYDQGVTIKPACAVTTTGASLTLSGATQVIDGVTAAAEMRVLVRNQTNSIDNGIYRVQSSSWLRAADCDGNRDLLPGTLAYVDRGSYYGGSLWVFNSSSTATSVAIGTDALTLSQSNMVNQEVSTWLLNNLFPVTSASSARSALSAAGTTDNNTFSGSNTFNSSNLFSGSNTFNSSNLFSGSNTFSATNTIAALNVSSGLTCGSSASFLSVAASSSISRAGVGVGVGWAYASAVSPTTASAILYCATAIGSTAVEIELMFSALTGFFSTQSLIVLLEATATATAIYSRIATISGAGAASNAALTNMFVIGRPLSTSGSFTGRVNMARLSASSTIWLARGDSVEDSSGALYTFSGQFTIPGNPLQLAMACSATTLFLGQSGGISVRWR